MEDNKRVFKFYAKPGEDFILWAAKTEAALEAQEVLDVVSADVVGDDIAALDDATKLKVAKARAIIIQGLDAKPLRVCLAEKSNPHKMWSRLQERYAVSNVATQVQLQTTLNRLRFTDQQMSDFVDSFEEIFNRLEGMGNAFPEQMRVAMLLSSFGEKSQLPYGHVVAAMQNSGQLLTWENVTARLLQEFEEKQWNTTVKGGSGPLNGALYARGQAQAGKKKRFEKRKCYGCGKRGHILRNCSEKKSKDSRYVHDNSDGEIGDTSAKVGRATLFTAMADDKNQFECSRCEKHS